MEILIAIEKGISTNNFIVKGIDYTKEKPYLIIDIFSFKEIGWRTLNELRTLNENIEDYNMPFDVYKRFYKYQSISDFDEKESSLIDLLENPINYVKEDDEIRNIIGLELEGACIELNVTRNETSEEKAPSKAFFDYYICEKFGYGDDEWDSHNYSDFFVDVEKIKSLIKDEKPNQIQKELYDNLVKSCRADSMYFSKINK